MLQPHHTLLWCCSSSHHSLVSYQKKVRSEANKKNRTKQNKSIQHKRSHIAAASSSSSVSSSRFNASEDRKNKHWLTPWLRGIKLTSNKTYAAFTKRSNHYKKKCTHSVSWAKGQPYAWTEPSSSAHFFLFLTNDGQTICFDRPVCVIMWLAWITIGRNTKRHSALTYYSYYTPISFHQWSALFRRIHVHL